MNLHSELIFITSNIVGLFAGSMYDGLSDGYSYGTARGSYYAKAHTGTNNWGHAVRHFSNYDRLLERYRDGALPLENTP